MGRCNELCTKEATGSCALCDALAERDRFIRIYMGGFLVESLSAFRKSVLAFPWHNVFSRILSSIVESPIKIAMLVFVMSTVAVIALTIKFFEYDKDFFQNILVEAHGMLFDILVIGIFILWLAKKGENRLENKRYMEEIEDFRGWESDEAVHRIAGNIKRLNRNGIASIDLSSCYLMKANLQGAQLQGAQLRFTNLQGAQLQGAQLRFTILWHAQLQGADLGGADLQGADLGGADLQGADLRGADLRGAENLSAEQLSTVHTLYQTRLDAPLLAQIQEAYPHLPLQRHF